MKLPPLCPESLNHQRKLLAYLRSAYTNAEEKLSFYDFMNIALYTPGLGYYSAGLKKLGQEGDFVTAPEISSLFSFCIAKQCAQVLKAFSSFSILELGAGSGKMAGEIIAYLASVDLLPNHYYILEISADLKERQQKYLCENYATFFERFVWLERLPESVFKGIILGNEVIDAMPVHLFQIGKEGKILEGYIVQQNQQWDLQFLPPKTPTLKSAIETLQHRLGFTFPIGYTSEILLHLSSWLTELSTCLEQGIMLFIDYGFPVHEYYHPSRDMGTLMCHYRHFAHSDPLQYIGMQDITAHVDFTALAIAAKNCQLEIAGFTHQAAFLLGNGLLDLVSSSRNLFEKESVQLNSQIHTLTAAHEMGELFKVMALSKNFTMPLHGFSYLDQRHRL